MSRPSSLDALFPGTAGVSPARHRSRLPAIRSRRDACGPRKKHLLLVVLLLFSSVFWITACNSNDPPPKVVVPGPPLGGSLNTLGWTDEGGNRSVFSDFRGKVLVLDFYATWCQPCRRSIPHLVGLQKQFGEQGLQVIGLNVGGPNDLPEVPAFAREFGIQYPLAIPDGDLVMFLMGDDNGIPQTFVFDRQGKLVERLTGFGPGSGEIIDQAVEAALQTPAQ